MSGALERLEVRQKEFLGWLLDPRRTDCEEKEDTAACKGSQASYARRKKIAASTLSRWKREPLFRRAWDERIQEVAGGPERLQRLLDELYAIAIGEDKGARTSDRVQAIKLHMETTGRHTPTTKVEIDDPALAKADDRTLLERSKERHARLSRLAKATPEVRSPDARLVNLGKI